MEKTYVFDLVKRLGTDWGQFRDGGSDGVKEKEEVFLLYFYTVLKYISLSVCEEMSVVVLCNLL